MRKYLALLLILLLCAFGAAAEGVQTEGEFDYIIQDLAWMDTKSVLIVGYHLPEGQTELFIPPELGGYTVSAVDMSGLPQSVETIYAYQPYAGIVPPVGRELTEIIYVDYALVQANADYKAKLPHMAEGDYALAEVTLIWRGEDGLQAQGAIPAAEVAAMTFPQELGGRKVHHDMLTNVSAEPGMTFASRPGGRAEIVDIRLAAGQNYVYIPVYWNDMVVYVEGETIPEQVGVVYTSWGGGIITPAEGRTLTEVFYLPYEEAKQYSEVKDIQPGDIALMQIRRFRTENGELVEEGSYYATDHRVEPGIPYVKAEELPKELDGHRVNATALGTGAFAELVGECWYKDQFGTPAIVDAQLTEGANELVIPTDFAGRGMVQVWMDNLDEGLRTIYQPYGLYVPLSTEAGLPRGVAYCKMLYADYAMVQADPALLQAFPDMGKDDYALVECDVEMAYDHEGNTWLAQIGFDPAALPTELRGHKLLLHPALNENVAIADYQQIYHGELDAEVAAWLGLPTEDELALMADNSASEIDGTVYTYGELLYTKDDAQQTAAIVGYELAEGQTELFIPTAIEGYTVVNFEYENVPLQIEKLWMNLNTGKTIWNFGDKPMNHERLTYNYTQTEKGSITLDNIALESWDENGQMTSKRQFIQADAVPATIAGNAVSFDVTAQGAIEDGTFVTADGWKYRAFSHADGRKTAELLDYPRQDWGDTMIIPPTVDGYVVNIVDIAIIPSSVHTVIMLGDGSSYGVVSNAPSNRVLKIVTYTDWEDAGQSAMISRPAEMQKNELLWTRVGVVDFATGKDLQEPHNIICDADLPAEINGQRVIFPSVSYDFAITSGDWRYIRRKEWKDDGEYLYATIWDYVGEKETGKVKLPTEIDGYTVDTFVIANFPEKLQIAYDSQRQWILEYDE